MSVSIFSVNARGIRNQLKRKALFLYCLNKNADFYFIQETHAIETDVSFWRNQWGRQIWFSFGNNKSAGVAILQGQFKGKVIKQAADTEGHWIMLLIEVDQSHFLIINTYGYNNKQHNKQLFLTLEEKI